MKTTPSKVREYARQTVRLLFPVREHQKLNRWVKPLNWLLPVGESWSVLTSVAGSAKTLWRRYKAALQERREREANLPELSYAQALAASGTTQATLLARYTRLKRLWLSFSALPVACAALIGGALLVTPLPATAPVVLRTLLLGCMLTALFAALFVQAVKCEYRRWQLREQRVSLSEHGTFNDFIRERPWVKETFISPARTGDSR